MVNFQYQPLILFIYNLLCSLLKNNIFPYHSITVEDINELALHFEYEVSCSLKEELEIEHKLRKIIHSQNIFLNRVNDWKDKYEFEIIPTLLALNMISGSLRIPFSITQLRENKGKTVKTFSSVKYSFQPTLPRAQSIKKLNGNSSIFSGNLINDFSVIYSKFPELEEQLLTGEDTNGLGNVYKCYLKQIQKTLESDSCLKNFSRGQIDEILSIINDFISYQVYMKAFPVSPSEKDTDTYQQLKKRQWIPSDYFEVRTDLLHKDLCTMVINELQKIDEKARPQEKLDCFVKAYQTIVEGVKALSGFDDEPGADEINPLVYFLTLKSAPKMVHTTMNYLQLFRIDSKRKADVREYCYCTVKTAISELEQLSPLEVKKVLEEKNISTTDFQ